jgi:SAM-dependent methyltransferase
MSLPAVFNLYSRYYDLLYQDKDYAGEAAFLQKLLKQHGMLKGDLLEFGSGTGKHGRLLAEGGYRVHGIELSADMLSRSPETDGFTCQQGDICNVQLGRTFNAVVSLFHVLSYQISNANLMAVFARAAEHLTTGGLFVFDFWYSPAIYAQRPAVRVKRMADADTKITRIAEPVIYQNENRVDVKYTIFATDFASGVTQTFTETHPMRHFGLPEIDLLANANNFARTGALEFLTGEPASEATWGVCVILKKL